MTKGTSLWEAAARSRRAASRANPRGGGGHAASRCICGAVARESVTVTRRGRGRGGRGGGRTRFACAALVCAAFASGCYLRLEGAEPIDLRAVYGDAGVVTLRGALGERVVLRCPCLERDITIAAADGRFELRGLPAGRYSIDYGGGGRSEGSCTGALHPGEYTVAITAYLITEVAEGRDDVSAPNPFDPPTSWSWTQCLVHEVVDRQDDPYSDMLESVGEELDRQRPARPGAARPEAP